MRRPALDTAPMILFGFEQLVRGGLRGVWTRGAVPPGAFVWAANHHSWWDGFVASVVLRHEKHAAALLMDAANLEKFSFLANAGVVAADRPRAALAALADGRALVVFPEGELRPAGALGAIAPGAGWLARQAGVPIVLAATRVVLRGQQSPEAYVDLAVASGTDLPSELAGRLRDLDAELAASDPTLPLPGFACVLKGRPSWDERISRLAAGARR